MSYRVIHGVSVKKSPKGVFVFVLCVCHTGLFVCGYRELALTLIRPSSPPRPIVLGPRSNLPV